jgi:hypothetical protein
MHYFTAKGKTNPTTKAYEAKMAVISPTTLQL